MTGVLVDLTDEWRLGDVALVRSAGLDARAALSFSSGTAAEFLPVEELDRAAERLAADPWLRHALAWQNPAVLANWAAGYRAGAATGRKRDRRMMALARYVQRYATKNDTIDFFGPTGWARLDQTSPGVVVSQGRGEIVRRHAHFEVWAIEALARRWETGLRPHLCPLRDPSSRLDGTTLLRPSGLTTELTPEQAAVLGRCDGRTPAVRIAAVHGEGALRVLEDLHAAGVVRWGFHLHFDEAVDDQLADQLAALAHLPAARDHLALLDELRAGRRAVDEAADAATALARLRDRYRTIAGTSAVLSKKDSAEQRTLLWSDALADWDVVLGADALAGLAEPLGLLLDACRWLTWRIGERVRGLVAESLAETPDGELSFDIVFDDLRTELTVQRSPVVAEVVRELQAVVAGLVDPDPAGGPVHLSGERLGPRWRKAFAAPRAGWGLARVHSADVMLTADRGWVLGELHVAVNPLDGRWATLNQRDFVDVAALVDRTTPGPRFLPAFPRSWARISPRTQPVRGVRLPDKDRYWTSWRDDVLPVDMPRIRALDLRVRREGEEVVVMGEGVHAPILELLGEFLSIVAVDAFRPFGEAPHTPRVSLDRLVVHRETWRFRAGDLVTPDVRALAAALRDRGVPLHFFHRLPTEPKPVFGDLSAEPLMRDLLRLLRGADPDAVLVVQEMLPGFDDLWLTGADGTIHTGEFRLVALDGRVGAGTSVGKQESR
ncbi:lantibiotic dehydratase [Saccharothrix deserti]|uniref:lantibiotic dehydratase n=1 Tax=Saccharothrix deserti TaxID=2593674 RepID=UPI00131DC1E4|nr:lantibiotic dehydratase [Saccharothrix deserti]